jgi:hypothetical protein
LGALAAALAVVAVLAVQALAVAFWPEVALFKPLDSFARSALFTAVPAFLATGLFAWLAARRPDPEGAFVGIAAVVLLVSFIPDYLLPVPDKTFLASTVAAVLHVVAAAVIVSVLVAGYRRIKERA